MSRYQKTIGIEISKFKFYFNRLSVSSDLRVDAERDLKDIGAGKIDVYPLNKVTPFN